MRQQLEPVPRQTHQSALERKRQIYCFFMPVELIYNCTFATILKWIRETLQHGHVIAQWQFSRKFIGFCGWDVSWRNLFEKILFFLRFFTLFLFQNFPWNFWALFLAYVNLQRCKTNLGSNFARKNPRLQNHFPVQVWAVTFSWNFLPFHYVKLSFYNSNLFLDLTFHMGIRNLNLVEFA